MLMCVRKFNNNLKLKLCCCLLSFRFYHLSKVRLSQNDYLYEIIIFRLVFWKIHDFIYSFWLNLTFKKTKFYKINFLSEMAASLTRLVSVITFKSTKGSANAICNFVYLNANWYLLKQHSKVEVQAVKYPLAKTFFINQKCLQKKQVSFF